MCECSRVEPPEAMTLYLVIKIERKEGNKVPKVKNKDVFIPH
jgi:hypothetical protein